MCLQKTELTPPDPSGSDACEGTTRADRAENNEIGDCFGMDIGGSLGKLVFLEETDSHRDLPSESHLTAFMRGGEVAPDNSSGSSGSQSDMASEKDTGDIGHRDLDLRVLIDKLGGTLHFLHFSTHQFDRAVDFVRQHSHHQHISRMHVTGGGAHRFRDKFRERLGICVQPLNELASVVAGVTFMTQYVSGECYTVEGVGLSLDTTIRRIPVKLDQARLFPFLLCNIGTGCSIVRVDGPDTWTRVSGTALGGGTFLGLCRLLTAASTFETAMNMAARGDATRVNSLVKDIYGREEELDSRDADGCAALQSLNLNGELTASFFAKVIACPPGDLLGKYAAEDISQALCVMISQNITQIAHLNARLQGLERIFFTGNFLRHNDVALKTIVYSMDRWCDLDQVRTESVFFRHEGYFGSIGALLASRKQQHEDGGGSSGCGSICNDDASLHRSTEAA